VELGSFVDVLLLVLLLILAQKAMTLVWKRLGNQGSASDDKILTE
jgi:hypothetical protein